MQFIVKYSAEVTIKSRPVRKRICEQLVRNLRVLLLQYDADCKVKGAWETLQITINPRDADLAACIETISRCTGIANFMEVVEYPLGELEDIYQQVAEIYLPLIAGKSYAVRCRRVGKHGFSSMDVERYVGGELMLKADAARVQLKKPQVTVRLEIRGDQLFVARQKIQGAGGFPIGSLDPVMALMSGGFDSTVASYLAMRRGLEVHFVLFSLGGREHQLAVQQIALYLWMKFARTQRLKFITVPFERVVDDIQGNVENGYVGVIMKRLMMKAAEQLCRKHGIKAMLTGDAVAQVASQTLSNMAVIDNATELLVFRPLAFMDKGDIIDIARAIGTEDFSKHVPEYCGAVAKRPRTKTRLYDVEPQEARLHPEVLEAAIASAEVRSMDELLEQPDEPSQELAPPLLAELPTGAEVLDIRHPDEQDARPLQLAGHVVHALPFFELNSRFDELPTDKAYFLYCDQGLMSRLHASYLLEAGHINVGVYRP